MLSTKKTIKTIGKSVELSGHIILLAAAVVGLFAIPLALAAADSKNKQESKNYHGHQATSQPPTVVNNNFVIFGNPFGWGSPSMATRVCPQEFLNGLLIYSLVSSAIGIALSLCLGVPWVAGLVGGLWLAGVGLAKLGEQIVSYAKQMAADVDVKQYASPEPSAPPLEEPWLYHYYMY